MRISDWSSDVCSSDLPAQAVAHSLRALQLGSVFYREQVMSESRECVLVLDLEATCCDDSSMARAEMEIIEIGAVMVERATLCTLDEFQAFIRPVRHPRRSEEHTSELQSLMRISYAVFCLK